eukprot:6155743-Pleurochrysis_carterae.AAC.2
MKQEVKEALVRDSSNRIASFLDSAMRSKAGLIKLRKLLSTYSLTMYPSMYDGVEMFKQLKRTGELARRLRR